MLIKKAEDIRSSEITPKNLYLNRRKFLAGAAVAGAAAATGLGLREMVSPRTAVLAGNKIEGIQKAHSARPKPLLPTKMSLPTTIIMSSPLTRMDPQSSLRISARDPGR